MGLVPWQATVTNETKQVVPNPVVTVRNVSDDTLATLYSDAAGTSEVNPITGDANGFVQFWAQPGEYYIDGAKGGEVADRWYWDAVDLSVNQPYDTRAAAVADLANVPTSVKRVSWFASESGPILNAVRKAGATSISDMPGWITDNRQTQFRQVNSGCNLIAHRGFRGINQENTLLAFSRADRVTKHWECDVAISADGTPYLFHDTTVDAVTNGTGTFTGLSDTYIDSLKFDGLSGTYLHDLVKVPTFDSFLLLASERKSFIWPELKTLRSDSDISIVVDKVAEFDMLDRCVFQSFSMDDTLAVLNNYPLASAGFLVWSSAGLAALQGFIDQLAEYPHRAYLLPRYTEALSHPSIVQYARDRDVSVGVWTVNTEDQLRELINIGVYSIMSDYPLGGI